MQEKIIYNGIKLPAVWPPRDIDFATDIPPEMPPYLVDRPAVIPINVGRQLFVDDFLIETTNLQRSFHYPEKYAGNPVLYPETDLELDVAGEKCALAGPKSGGLWWDYDEHRFKLWYEAGFMNAVCYAESSDGLHWSRPSLDIVPGTNQVSPPGLKPDSWTIIPDYFTADPQQKYKIFLREPDGGNYPGWCFCSPDGLHWGDPVVTGLTGDRSTMFYNPFRRKWCFSLRSGYDDPDVTIRESIRTRHYYETDDFPGGTQWIDWKPNSGGKAVPWAHADKLDLPDPEIGRPTQLYNLDAVAYESLMLGFFLIHRGPPNAECTKLGLPKITELNFAYSRDGFHWYRPDRTPAIRAERCDVWDRGYIQSLGNLCTVSRNRIAFYYIATRGNPARGGYHGVYDRGATGVAFLRRDGFVSMDSVGCGSLTTRPVIFNGSHLFINAAATGGELRAEILDLDYHPIIPFSMTDSLPFTADSTAAPMSWNSGGDISALKNRPVRIRFQLCDSKLFSFWVSQDSTGRSDGYVAGGGPDYTGPIDNVGLIQQGLSCV